VPPNNLLRPSLSWAEATERYDLTETEVELSEGLRVRVTHVRDLNAILDGMTEEDFGADERLPYWATLWPSAIELARRLIRGRAPGHREFSGPAIELGSGLGLGAIALAAAGVADPVATDYEQEALLFASHNAEQNGVRIETRLLDWRELARRGPAVAGLAERFRTVVASDVLYEARNVVPLASSLARLLDPGGYGLVADPGRPHLVEFRAALEERGLPFEEERVNGIFLLLIEGAQSMKV
jgi:predicted nicotinamide N-methyase